MRTIACVESGAARFLETDELTRIIGVLTMREPANHDA
jgi:hypothetical protein